MSFVAKIALVALLAVAASAAPCSLWIAASSGFTKSRYEFDPSKDKVALPFQVTRVSQCAGQIIKYDITVSSRVNSNGKVTLTKVFNQPRTSPSNYVITGSYLAKLKSGTSYVAAWTVRMSDASGKTYSRTLDSTYFKMTGAAPCKPSVTIIFPMSSYKGSTYRSVVITPSMRTNLCGNRLAVSYLISSRYRRYRFSGTRLVFSPRKSRMRSGAYSVVATAKVGTASATTKTKLTLSRSGRAVTDTEEDAATDASDADVAADSVEDEYTVVVAVAAAAGCLVGLVAAVVVARKAMRAAPAVAAEQVELAEGL